MVSKYKTKFPMARIKKIMQVDEEIGKVAQGTPIVISKALELFLQNLIDKASGEIAASTSRISRSTIKRVIGKTEEYDFLKDLVKEVPDDLTEEASASPKTTPSKRGNGDDDDAYEPSASDDEQAYVTVKKRRSTKASKMNISALCSSDADQ